LPRALFERCEQDFKKRLIVLRDDPGLTQPEIAGNEEHHHHNPNDVKNIVHISFSFLSRYRITVEPDARNITAREAV